MSIRSRDIATQTLVCMLSAAVVLATPAGVVAQAAPRVFTTAAGEWPSYTGDVRGSRYSPLSQITAENFSSLEVAWRFKTDALGPRPEFKLEEIGRASCRERVSLVV